MKKLKYIINGTTYFATGKNHAELKKMMFENYNPSDMVSVVRPEDDEEIDLLMLKDLFNLPNRKS